MIRNGSVLSVTMMMSLILLGLLATGSAAVESFSIDDDLLNLATGSDPFQAFHQWMTTYGKSYRDLLTTWTKYKVFKENVKRAIDLNIKHQGQAIFGLTKFADLTPEEFSFQYLIDELEKALNHTIPVPDLDMGRRYGAKQDDEAVTDDGSSPPPSTTPPPPPSPPPDSLDWTKEGVVTPVKDQGRVGTCYIFSALAVIESRWAQKGNSLISLSAEQVADCLAVFGGLFSDIIACGVNGGTQAAVYKYVRDEGGIEPEEAYPYCVGSGECRPCQPENYPFIICGTYPIDDCRKKDSCERKLDRSLYVPGLKVRSWSYVSRDEDEILSVLAEDGPLSTALDATDLQLYKGGILMPDRCKPNGLNHAVTFVGYGEENGVKFWRLKNSWGTEFGEEGYFRIARGEGACGINKQVNTVVLE